MACPFAGLEEREEQEEDAQAKPFGQKAMQAAVGQEMAKTGQGLGEMVGPLLALFTILRGVQVAGGLPVGNVTKAGMAEEATTRVLRPKPPGTNGSGMRPGRVAVGGGIRGGAGGMFVNQAAEMQKLMGRR